MCRNREAQVSAQASAATAVQARPDRVASLLAWWQRTAPTGDQRPPSRVAVLDPQAEATDVDRHVDRGADLLLLATLNVPRADVVALVAALTGHDEIDVLGWPDDSDVTWTSTLKQVRELIYRFSVRTEPDVLATAVHPALAGSAEVLARCAARRTPVIFDGTSHASAALIAAAQDPTVRAWWQPALAPADNAGTIALEHLGLTAAVDLGCPDRSFPGHQLALTALQLALQQRAAQADPQDQGEASQDD